jgi:hypothetical protein
MGSFGFAAEAAGLLRLGPMMLSTDVRDTYVAFHGYGSDTPLADAADLVVADLPFSMFLDGKNADPEIIDVIKLAKAAARKNGAIVFRVKWDIGQRLLMPQEEYLAVVRTAFPKHLVAWFVDSNLGSDSLPTTDLYIVVSSEVIDLTDFNVPDEGVTAIHPVPLDDPALDKIDPQLILDALGFPEDFSALAANLPNVHERLRECVAIRRAKLVLEFVASHIRG